MRKQNCVKIVLPLVLFFGASTLLTIVRFGSVINDTNTDKSRPKLIRTGIDIKPEENHVPASIYAYPYKNLTCADVTMQKLYNLLYFEHFKRIIEDHCEALRSLNLSHALVHGHLLAYLRGHGLLPWDKDGMCTTHLFSFLLLLLCLYVSCVHVTPHCH